MTTGATIPQTTSAQQTNTPAFWGQLFHFYAPQRSVAFWQAWVQTEGTYSNGRNNPLNLIVPGQPGVFQVFSSPLAGAQATLAEIKRNYPQVLSLPSDQAAVAAVGASKWGTSGSLFQTVYSQIVGGVSGATAALFVPLSQLFSNVSNAVYRFGESVPGIGPIDIQGLQSQGSTSGFFHDIDYALTAGTPVHLPGESGVSYTFLNNVYGAGKWGNLLYFRTPNGGIVGFPHLENLPNLVPGQSYSGGTQIGTVGSGAGLSAPYWQGQHLSVIADNAAAAFFDAIQTGGPLPAGSSSSGTGGAGLGSVPIVGGPLAGAGDALGATGNFFGGLFGGAGAAIGGIPGAITGGFQGLTEGFIAFFENIFVRVGFVLIGLVAAVLGFMLLTDTTPEKIGKTIAENPELAA